MQDIESRFWELCDEADCREKAYWQTVSDENVPPDEVEKAYRASEQAMVEIIALVETHPDHRSIFVCCFSDLFLWKRQAPYLLVPFCMRRLRFQEIPELLAQEANEHKGTAYYASRMNYWSAISHAYVDEVWENARSFEFYKHELTS